MWRALAGEIVNYGDEGVEAPIGVFLGFGEFLQGYEGSAGLDRQFVNPIREDYLGGEQALVLLIESHVIVDEEVHQSFHPVDARLPASVGCVACQYNC